MTLKVANIIWDNFKAIFPNQDVTTDQVYDSLQQVMKSDTQLAKYAI